MTIPTHDFIEKDERTPPISLYFLRKRLMLAGPFAFRGAGTADKTKAVGEPQPPVVQRSVTKTDCSHTSAPVVPPRAFGKAQKTSRWLPDCRSSTWMRQAPDGSHAHIVTEVTEAPPRLNCRLSLRIYPEGRAVRRIALTDIQPSSDAFPAPRNSGIFLRLSVNQESQVANPRPYSMASRLGENACRNLSMKRFLLSIRTDSPEGVRGRPLVTQGCNDGG